MSIEKKAPLNVCVAGATGWAGSALSRGIFAAPDLELVAAISRTHAGKTVGQVIGVEGLAAPIYATEGEALTTRPDVFVEYTEPDAAKAHNLAALNAGAHRRGQHASG